MLNAQPNTDQTGDVAQDCLNCVIKHFPEQVYEGKNPTETTMSHTQVLEASSVPGSQLIVHIDL